MKKYLYLVLGLGIIIWSITITAWFYFYEDIIYLFERPESYTAQVNTAVTLLSWFFGIVYLWYGIKSDKINKISNWSIIILSVSSLVSVILMFFACFNIGNSIACPLYSQIASNLYVPVFGYGVLISFFLLIISLFRKNKVKSNN
jgi:membrane protease YdiL (CAAX protease family)